MTYIILAILAVLVIWALSSYNKFVTLKTQIEASIQEIGNQLKRQAELIPNLVSSVKGYMKHEKGIFEDLTSARKQVLEVVAKPGSNPQELIDASTHLEKAMSGLRVTLESNPEIKADQPTQKLMDELRDTSDKTMYSRRTLIDLSQNYNAMVVRMPSALIAMLFNFKKETGLKIGDTQAATTVTSEETKTPKVDLS